MRIRTTTAALLAGAVALLGSGLIPSARAADEPVDGESPAECGPDDIYPETGIQGDVPRADQESGRTRDGYICGISVVAHGDAPEFGTGALAWSGHCAYIQGGDGIQVINVSDPTGPFVANVVTETFGSSENMSAVTTDERALLVSGGGVYDVRNCEEPVLVGAIEWPGAVPGGHNVKLSPDATKVYGSMPLAVVDITDLDSSTWEVQMLQCDVAAQVHPAHAGPAGLCRVLPPEDFYALLVPGPQLAHEPELDLSGDRLYIGGQQAYQPREEYFRVLDTTVWPPQVLSEIPGSAHGASFATIDGRPFVLHSNEGGHPGFGCIPSMPADAPPAEPGAYGYLNADVAVTDVSDDSTPTIVSRIRLAINDPVPDRCAAQIDSFLGPLCSKEDAAASKGCTGSPHFHTVDDPSHTTFALLSMRTAGLRIFDVRDPEHPVEVAYFNPGEVVPGDIDHAGTHPHYDTSTGHIWFVSRSGGFWVLELQSQVRDALDLPTLGCPRPTDPRMIARDATTHTRPCTRRWRHG